MGDYVRDLLDKQSVFAEHDFDHAFSLEHERKGGLEEYQRRVDPSPECLSADHLPRLSGVADARRSVDSVAVKAVEPPNLPDHCPGRRPGMNPDLGLKVFASWRLEGGYHALDLVREKSHLNEVLLGIILLRSFAEGKGGERTRQNVRVVDVLVLVHPECIDCLVDGSHDLVHQGEGRLGRAFVGDHVGQRRKHLADHNRDERDWAPEKSAFLHL
mmetsp:Transcript_33065/g.78344  ORF Transcript_33065/g.78344 Transcript_33065/m.78344 type:complete len:215 (-) Transcript_33065:805-1449(-)